MSAKGPDLHVEQFVSGSVGGEGGVLLFLERIHQGLGIFLFADRRDLHEVAVLARDDGGGIGWRHRCLRPADLADAARVRRGASAVFGVNWAVWILLSDGFVERQIGGWLRIGRL